jgi:hypothetical protein
MEGLLEHSRGNGYIVSTWRNLMLILWSEVVSHEGLDACDRAGRKIQRTYPNQQIAISITLAGVHPIPDNKVREHAARLLKETADRVKLSVTVIEGDGFWLSAGRMVMTALVSLSGGKSKTAIAKSIDEAGALARQHVTPDATLDEMMEVLRFFREEGIGAAKAKLRSSG